MRRKELIHCYSTGHTIRTVCSSLGGQLQWKTRRQQIGPSLTANQITRTNYEEALEMAILTPLPEAFECRRCSAAFNTNNKLHSHIRGRECHAPTSATKKTIPTALAIAPTATTAASIKTSLLATPTASHTAHQATVTPTAGLLTSPPVSSPPTYRAVSPSPPTYRAISPGPRTAPRPSYNPGSYLTVQDLCKRFALAKSTHSDTHHGPFHIILCRVEN